MNAWVPVWNDLAALWAASLWRATLQGSAAILLVWAVCRALPRLSPDVQCWLWRLAYLKLLLALFWATPVDLPLLPGEPVATLYPAAHPPPAERLLAASRPAPPPPSVTGTAWLLLLWLLGVCGVVARRGGQWAAARRFRRTFRPLADPEVLGVYAGLAGQLGLRRQPALMVSGPLGGPMLTGAARPAIVLPASLLGTCSPGDLRLVLVHELAHFRRRDLWWNWLAMAAHAVFFFHPLLRLAQREYRLAQELACDEAALRATRSPTREYGALLVSIAARVRPAERRGLAALHVVESYAGLRRRLLALRELRPASPPGRSASGVLVGLAALAGLVPWRLVAGGHVTYLDLQPLANQKLSANFQGAQGRGNDLASLPRGDQILGEARFRIEEGCIQLGGALFPGHPERVEGIPVHRPFSTLSILHAAGWGGGPEGSPYHVADGTLIGRYTLHYADGGQAEIPIVYGHDVRDWWVARGDPGVTRGQVVWTGQNGVAKAFGATGIRLYLASWKNPRPRARVLRIDYSSTGTAAAPFCVALTASDGTD